jgi:rare lipoprotein A
MHKYFSLTRDLRPLLLLLMLFFFLAVFNGKVISQTANNKTSSQKVKRVFYGRASFYSNKFNGRKTASGEIFSQQKLTCACNALPMGTWVRVTDLQNERSVIVKVNDRLHPKMKRIVDLTKKAAITIGLSSSGLTRVKVEVLGKRRPHE